MKGMVVMSGPGLRWEALLFRVPGSPKPAARRVLRCQGFPGGLLQTALREAKCAQGPVSEVPRGCFGDQCRNWEASGGVFRGPDARRQRDSARCACGGSPPSWNEGLLFESWAVCRSVGLNRVLSDFACRLTSVRYFIRLGVPVAGPGIDTLSMVL